ncbi:MAG: response regulator [Acetobacteraceae bacterium]|nr:response regulator [Acetobacteraceae bacterium]
MTRPVAPLRVLIVEDEALLAMDLEAMMEDAGHLVVAEAASLAEVVALDVSLDPAIAFVDFQLAKGSSGLDAARFIARRWPEAVIVFVTANPLKVPHDFAGAHGIIAKPFSRTGLLSAMNYIAEGVIDPPPVSRQPTSFVASQACALAWAPTEAR